MAPTAQTTFQGPQCPDRLPLTLSSSHLSLVLRGRHPDFFPPACHATSLHGASPLPVFATREAPEGSLLPTGRSVAKHHFLKASYHLTPGSQKAEIHMSVPGAGPLPASVTCSCPC